MCQWKEKIKRKADEEVGCDRTMVARGAERDGTGQREEGWRKDRRTPHHEGDARVEEGRLGNEVNSSAAP
ncbi:unnamed protein product [Lampetra planeri]